MEHEFGKKLEAARTARGLSIEQAAAAVRIRSTFLRSLESSDLTKFPNAAYAKSFLLMYSRFLAVDLKSVAAGIDTTTQMKVEGYQYLTSRAAEQPRAKAEAEPSFSMAPAPSAAGSWLPLIVLGGIIVFVAVAFVVWSNLNRLGDSQSEPARPAANQPGNETAVQPVASSPKPVPAPKPAVSPAPPPQLPEPEPPRPVVISLPKTAVTPAQTPAPAPAAEPEIPRARPISPVARMAAADTEALADLTGGRTRAPGLPPVASEPPIREEGNSFAADSNTIILEPRRKTWVIVRNSRGGQPVYEDYLYPTAKPMRLPAGRYFIELKDADAVEISRNGKRLVYSAPGLMID